MLTITNLTKGYDTPTGRLDVLRGLSLSLAAGESLALTGDSGSGKSTLLHVIAGLDQDASGEVTIGDHDLFALSDEQRADMRRATVGLIFQQFNLIPSLTAGENLTFQARLAGRFDAKWAGELARRLGIHDILDRYPDQLSGGQQQRVAIGRTFANRPHLVLADEPTGNLDEEASERVIDLSLDLVRETNAALLMVTHSQALAGRLGRRARLHGGLIEEAGGLLAVEP